LRPEGPPGPFFDKEERRKGNGKKKKEREGGGSELAQALYTLYNTHPHTLLHKLVFRHSTNYYL